MVPLREQTASARQIYGSLYYLQLNKAKANALKRFLRVATAILPLTLAHVVSIYIERIFSNSLLLHKENTEEINV